MSTARERREAARAKLEMRMAEKHAIARRKRRIKVGLSSILAVAVLAGLGWFLVETVDFSSSNDSASDKEEETRTKAGDGEPKEDVVVNALSMSKPASASKGATKCTYRDVKPQQGQKLEDVGKPGSEKKPNTGKQDMTLDLEQGKVTGQVDNAKAPCAAASFTYLAGKKFFDDSKCHRLTTEKLFVLQCGDPSATGSGGPQYKFDNEYVPKDTAKGMSEKEKKAGKQKPNYKAGTLAMANSGKGEDGHGTNGSQFFIVYEDTYLPPDYTVLGKVTKGLDVVRDIAKKGAWKDPSQQPPPQQ